MPNFRSLDRSRRRLELGAPARNPKQILRNRRPAMHDVCEQRASPSHIPRSRNFPRGNSIAGSMPLLVKLLTRLEGVHPNFFEENILRKLILPIMFGISLLVTSMTAVANSNPLVVAVFGDAP